MELSLSKLLSLMLKHLLAIALCALIGLFGAFGISKFLIAPQYTASVKMFVEMTDQSAVNIYGLNELNYVRSLVPSYIEMLQVNDFYRKLAEDANVDYTPAQLRDDIGFSIQNDTQVFKISVSTRSAAIPRRSRMRWRWSPPSISIRWGPPHESNWRNRRNCLSPPAALMC